MELLNVTGGKYQPPYCLNARRVYNMLAVFGIIKYNDIRRTMIKSGANPRCIVSMKVTSQAAMTLVTTYWSLIESANVGNNEDIKEAEHMFHQVLLQKTSAYSNTIGKLGNLFDITIRASPHGAEIILQPQRSLAYFLGAAGLAV